MSILTKRLKLFAKLLRLMEISVFKIYFKLFMINLEMHAKKWKQSLEKLTKKRLWGSDLILTDSINTDKLTSYDINAEKEINDPLVRVFVTTYNNVKFTRHNLNGILKQKTNFPFEIYIYDDCSTDGTSDIIREYAQKHPNIIADIQSENYYSKDKQMQCKKILSNMKNHNCKYVAIADGDDYWIDQYKLQIQIDFLENNIDFNMCSGGYLTNNDFNGKQQLNLINTKKTIGFEYQFQTFIPPFNSKKNTGLFVKNFTSVYRASIIQEYEIVQKYKFWRDVHNWYYSLKEGKGYYFSRIFGVYNIHSGGIYGGLSLEQKTEIDFEVYKELYRETKDKFVKRLFITFACKFIIKCLKTKEQRIDFYNSFSKIIKEAKETNNA